MVDTHAHLVLCGPEPAQELVESARMGGVDRILSVGLDEESNAATVAVAQDIEQVFACVGRHPNQTIGFDARAEDDLRQLCSEDKVIAVGETGLDLYREGSPIAEQRKAFLAQIGIARDHSLPLVIHLRDRDGSTEVLEEAFATLESEAAGLPVILHCFSADVFWAERAATNGWYCSFAGNVTYPSAELLREASRVVPDGLLLVETDSPFLAPEPMRGSSNRPVNVIETAKILAAERDIEFEDLDRLVSSNAGELFGW